MSSSHTLDRSSDDGTTRIARSPILGEPSAANPSFSRLPLVRWLLTTELGDAEAPLAERAAARRVFYKLSQRLAQLISPVGFDALLARAVHLSLAEFPFLEGVQAAPNTASLIDRLCETAANVEPSQAHEGFVTVLRNLLALLELFIGERLTLRLLRDVWPELPMILPDPPDGGQ